MCTAIAYKGDDLIYGFNLDIDPAVWKFSVHKNDFLFAVGITVGKTTYYVHGVNSRGQFGNVPYMNGTDFPAARGMKRERIDLMSDRYIRGKYSFEDIEQTVRTKAVVNIPAATMHSLIGSGNGDFLIVEPGYGVRKVRENYAVLTNFPTLTTLDDYSNPFYGKDRYDKAVSLLSNADGHFSAEDALRLLYETKQTGQWATRLSFVYSANRGAVLYFTDGNINDIRTHSFGSITRNAAEWT